MRRFLTFLLLIMSFAGLHAQSYFTTKTAASKALKSYDKGRDYMRANSYDKAIKEFDKAIAVEPKFVNAFLLKADAYNQNGDYKNAVANFDKVIEIAPTYKTRVYYVLGMIHFRAGEYSKSISSLQTYLTFPVKDLGFKKIVEKHIANAKFAKEAVLKPVPFEPKNMGPSINTSNLEYWPSISIDGEIFVFTRQVNRNEDFYVSVQKENNWQKAVNIGPPINTPLNEGAQTLSADGRYFAFTVCNRPGILGKCDIFIAERRSDGSWAEPKNMGAPINSQFWESQPALSPDGNTIIYVRGVDSRDKNTDLLISHRKNGKWSTPKKLPVEINTLFAEESPFLHPDGQTLYFVSDGHPGMGGDDIFFSRKQDDGSWGQAQNIGYPINTGGDEFSIIVSFDGSTGYFSSDMEGGFGGLDIYSFEMPKDARPQRATYLKAIVFDAETKIRLQADIEFIDLTTNQLHTQSQTNRRGEFLTTLPLGKDYALNVSKEKYLFHSENFALKDVSTSGEPFLLEIGLQKIPEVVAKPDPAKPPVANKPVVLKNVFFNTASAELLDKSRTELDKLVKLLKDNPTMKIRLNGHTDNVGTDSDNMTLSDNRAKAVVNYLIDNGIEAPRLRSKGFGETSPVDTNDTPKGRANNRRTEFEIW